MKHPVIRWNPATQEHFCPKCGRTSKEVTIEDAREQLEQYECEIASVDTAVPAPGDKTVRLMRKSYKS
jgi:uncharacterized Zn finger protein (UPF0148 family)